MKRILTLINILLISATSFLGVDTVYKLFAAQLDVVDSPEPVLAKRRSKPLEPLKNNVYPLSHYSAIVQRDIFQTRTANSAAKVEKIAVADIKPTEKNLKLWGTVVGDSSANTYAIIEEPGAGARRSRSTQMLFRPGDTVQGATIKKILREKIILSVAGKNEILQLVERKSSGRYRGGIRRANNQLNRQPVRRKRTLRRSQIQQAIGDIGKLQSQARIRPHSEGFQISRIRPRSIFRRLGLRNGDIITAVGGRAITSANDAVDIWRNLTAGADTSVEIKRRGRTQIIDYRIR